jgi:hypothetical protein
MGRARAFTAKVAMLRDKPTGQVGTIGIGGPLLAMVKVPRDLPAFINALAPNGRMHFEAVKSVPIIGE